MPTKNYFNLSKSKQESILNSAKKEFSSYAYEDVSIFQIAKNAGISRSSFYCYFSDKMDIYHYVLSQILEEIKSYIFSISSPPYDVFDVITYIFEYFTMQKNTEKQDLITKAFENFNPKIQDFLTCNFELDKNNCLLNFTNLNLQKSQLKYFGLTVISCLAIHTLEFYLTDITLEAIKKKFICSLDILKYGVKKEKK